MRAAVLALLTLAALLAPARAQEVPDPLIEQRRAAELAARTSDLGGFQPQGGAPDPGPAQAPGGPCFQVNTLTVTGVTRFSAAKVAALMAPYAPRCLQGADIQAAMRALDAAYAERGFITTRTYIPPQNLTSGSLTLAVLEGHVEGIYLLGPEGQIEGPRARRLLATAFPWASGTLFNLRGFEQGLDQMNRLPSVQATMLLQPGETPGGSQVLVQRLQTDRFRGLLRFDTLGSEGTGKDRLTLESSLDDLFGANDTWTLGLASTANTNALTFSGSVPFGATTLSLDAGHSEYLSALSPLAELFGTTRTASLSLARMLHRDQTSTTEGTLALSWRKAERLINAAALTPQRVTTLSLGLRHIRLGEASRQSYDVTLSWGLPALGAPHDTPGAAADVPRGQFTRIEAGWQRQGALSLGRWGAVGTLVTDLRTQYSHDTLYANEQMGLGSFSTVRGYDGDGVAGEVGAYLRNDLYLAPEVWTRILPQAWRQDVAERIQPYVFLDLGQVRDLSTHKIRKVAGAGLGLSWSLGRVTASGLIGYPLIDSDKDGRRGPPVIQIRADLKTW